MNNFNNKCTFESNENLDIKETCKSVNFFFLVTITIQTMVKISTLIIFLLIVIITILIINKKKIIIIIIIIIKKKK